MSVVIMQLHFLRRDKSKGGYVESGGREDEGQKSSVVFSDSEQHGKTNKATGCKRMCRLRKLSCPVPTCLDKEAKEVPVCSSFSVLAGKRTMAKYRLS